MGKLHVKLNIQRFAVTCWIECTTTNQSIQNNTSDVRVTFYIKRTGGTTYWEKPNYRTLTLTCDGSSQSQSIQFKQGSVGQVSSYYADFNGIQHNNDGTKYIEFSGTIPASGNFSKLEASGNATLTTIPRYFTSSPTLSLVSKTETTATFRWTTSENCDQVQYKINSGSWVNVSGTGTSGTYTITGLTAGQTYTIYGDYKRADSQLWSTWGGYTVSSPLTTHNYPYVVSSNTFTIGNSITTNIYNPLGRTVTLYYYGKNDALLCTATKTSNGSTTITPTSTEINNQYASIPSDPSSTYRVRLICSELSRDNSYSFGTIYQVNENNCRPTMTTVGYVDGNNTTLALTGNNQTLINGYSTIKVTIASNNKPTPTKSASGIRGYQIQNGSYTSDEVAESVGNDVVLTCPATSNVIKVIAIDTRGVTNSYTIPNVTLINYTPITKNANPKAERCDSSGTPNGVGEYVKITLGGEFWNNSFGSVTNAITTKSYQYKNNKSSSSPITGATSLTVTTDNNEYDIEQLILGDKPNGFDIQNTYTIWVTIGDKLSSTTFTITLTSGTPLIAYADDGIAIKKMYDTNDSSALQVQGSESITGNIDFKSSNSHIYWKEPGYGDKFKILPDFGGTDDSNKLKLQGAVGGSGTDPSLYDLATISGKSGNAWIKGFMQIPSGIYSADTGNVGTQTPTGKLVIKKATSSEAPNNGIVLEYGNSNNWVGQLYLGDNANTGCYWNGWYNGTRGSWKKLAFLDEAKAVIKTQEVSRSITQGTGGDWWTVGAYTTPSGYTAIGAIITAMPDYQTMVGSAILNNGYAVAQLYNFASSSKTGTVKVRVIFLQN